jgi:hypothetical protein
MTDVLDGSTETVPVIRGPASSSGPARLQLDDAETEPRALNVVVGDAVVGQVASDYYTEVRQLLELGFALQLYFDNEQAMLSVSLAARVT